MSYGRNNQMNANKNNEKIYPHKDLYLVMTAQNWKWQVNG